MLLPALRQRDAASPVWLDAAGCWTAAAAVARTHELRAAWAPLAGARVAVQLAEPLAFVQALLALHGVADALLLLPASWTPEQRADFVRRAGCTWIVADTDPGLAHCTHAPLPPAHGDSADEADDGRDTRWLLTTSGTTGTPKIVTHTLDTLAATVQRAADGNRHRWGLLYDPARFAGLQVVLQALLGGSSLVLPPAGLAFEPALALFAAEQVNALSASPTLWRKLLMAGAELPALATITLGGEVADARILQALAQRFPNARRRHVYASTEAGVGFSVGDGEEGFPSRWLHEPPPGIQLRIGDGGELMLRSTRTAAGYHDGPALADADGWVPSGDRVVDDGRRVCFAGRINGAVNIGGDKVFPETVEQVLLQHPAVFSARVRAKPSAFTGALIEALVVPDDGIVADGPLKTALLGHCRERLPRHAVPALLRFVSQLDVNASGKQDRRA